MNPMARGLFDTTEGRPEWTDIADWVLTRGGKMYRLEGLLPGLPRRIFALTLLH